MNQAERFWHPDDEDKRLRSARTGLWCFLAVATSLFLLFTVAFLARSQFEDWQPLASEPWQPLFDHWQLWTNTSLLILASLAMQWATVEMRRNCCEDARVAFTFGGICAFFFLIGQLYLWHQLSNAGHSINSNAANSFFYVLTALHGLHLLGGLMVWIAIVPRLFKPLSIVQLRRETNNINLCSRYWHFLLLIWLALFALLVSPPATLSALAALCGF